MRDHAARANDRLVANGHAGTNDSPGAYPHTVSDMNRSCINVVPFVVMRKTVWHPAYASFPGGDRVKIRDDGHIWPDHNIVSDVDFSLVHYHKIVVGQKILADKGVEPVVDVQRRLNVIRLPIHAAKYFAKQPISFWLIQ